MDGLRCSYGQYSRTTTKKEKKTTTLTLVYSLFLALSLLCLGAINVAEAFDLNTIPFDEGFSPLFGDGNLVRSPDGKAARLLLNRYTGITHAHTYLQTYIEGVTHT